MNTFTEDLFRGGRKIGRTTRRARGTFTIEQLGEGRERVTYRVIR